MNTFSDINGTILQKKRDAELAKRTLPAVQGPAPCPQYERGDL
jgi:hypothetical protein